MSIRRCLAGSGSPKADTISAIQMMSKDYVTTKAKTTLMMMIVIIFTEECQLSVIFMKDG
jgi:hypothetical protein